MSTILKALRRLEQEKARTDRPLREQVTGPGGADRGDGRPPRRWPILLGGVGAGVVAGLAMLWLVFSRGDSAREAAPEAAAPPAATAAAAPPAPSPQAAPRATRRSRPIAPAQPPAAPSVPAPAARAALPEPEGPEDVAVIDRGSPGPRIIAEPPAPGAEPSAPKPGSVRPLHRADPRALPGRHVLPEDPEAPLAVPEAASAQAPAPATSPRPAEPARTPEPALRAVAPARSPAEQPRAEPAEPAEAPRAAAKASPDRAVDPAPSAPFPALRVERTSWHPVAARRVALIDVPGQGAQSVHEGGLVAGALVKRIEPSAVVFEHAGREVRRKIGVP